MVATMTPAQAVARFGPVPLDLTTVDGNAFMLIGAFQRAARRAGWPDAAIAAVREEATSGNYDHLLRTLIEVTES